MDRAYWRCLFTAMPQAALAAWQQHRWQGLYLVLCVFVWKRLWWPVQIHPLIRLTQLHEAVNYLDNFILGELRLFAMEDWLRQTEGAVIEVGVNVGITTRWWLAQNSSLHVIGIDMMKEALDYTGRCVSSINLGVRWHPLVGAVGDAAGTLTVSFDDPLEGTNSLDQKGLRQQRQVEVNTLDAYLKRAPSIQPRLLKLDIEGHAASALRGSSELLQKVNWVVVETHHLDELGQSSHLLIKHGFCLRHFQGRTMWWSRLG